MAVYADPGMREVTNPDHASPATILFQRGSVITFDIVLALGAEDVLAALLAGLRPQGGVQAAPLPRGAHGHLHHPLQVAGKNILSYRRIFDKFESVKILSCLKILVTVIH